MPSLQQDKLAGRFDAAIRFFFYLLIFWLPYSIAVVETAVTISIILWLVKRCLLNSWQEWRRLALKDKLSQLWKTFRPAPSFLDYPILYFLIICAISASVSHLRLMSLHGLFTKILEWFAVYFLIIEVFKTEKQIWLAVGILLFTTASTAIDSFVQFYITGKDIFLKNEISRGGATAGFSHANGLAGYLAGMVPLICSLLWLQHKEKKNFFLFVVILVLVMWSLILTLSRAAWTGVFGGIAVLLFFIKRRVGFWFTVTVLTLFISLYAFLPYRIFENSRLDWNYISDSANWRIGIWEDSLKMIQARPLLGHGPNTFMPLFQNYRRMPSAPNIYNPTYAHNCYLQIWAEVGFLGGIGFLWMLGNLLFYTKAAMDRARPGALNLSFLLIGLSTGVVAFLIHSFFDTNFYSVQLSIYFWMLVAIMVSICHLIPSTKFSA